jgi:hypothetical protein
MQEKFYFLMFFAYFLYFAFYFFIQRGKFATVPKGIPFGTA